MVDEVKDVNPINIGNINDGALIEAFDIELRKVLENIRDINTPATATRSLTLTVTFKPHGDRCTVATEVGSKLTLAPIEKHSSKVFLGVTDEGVVVAFDKDPLQMPLWTAPKPKEASVLKFNAGDNK